jgi:predicted RNA-binding protein YlqC (UPF0109 family)
MPKRISKIRKSLKNLGEIQVNDWELPEIIHKDISELKIGRSIRRLGEIRVTEWDIKDVIPAVNKIAQTEVDIVGIVKRIAEYKVLDWDFSDEKKQNRIPSDKELANIGEQLLKFLHYTITPLINQPRYLSIHTKELTAQVLQFHVVMVKRDVSMLIGVEGHTAKALRNILKAAAKIHGVNALLKIQSHEEAAQMKSDY